MDRRTFSVTIAERDAAVVRRIRAGETLEAVGKDYGISRERVRQVASKAGLRPCENKDRRYAVRKQVIMNKIKATDPVYVTYTENKDAIEAVMGESFSLVVNFRRRIKSVVGDKTGAKLRMLSPARHRMVGGKDPRYYGVSVTTTDRYMFRTPDGRLFAIKPGTELGKHVYVPAPGVRVKHQDEPRYVEITK